MVATPDFTEFFQSMEIIRDAGAQRQDRTIDAEIVSLQNATEGKYRVLFEGNTFDAYLPTSMPITYSAGERVYVLVPQGDFSAKKIILGRSAYENNITADEMQQAVNFWIEKGPNWLEDWYRFGWQSFYETEDKTLQITAQPRETGDINYLRTFYDVGFARGRYVYDYYRALRAANYEVDAESHAWTLANRTNVWNSRYNAVLATTEPVGTALQMEVSQNRWTSVDIPSTRINFYNGYTYVEQDFDAMKRADTQVQNYSKAFSYIKVAADFRTDFRTRHDQGEYGLVVELLINNPQFTFDVKSDNFDPTQPPYLIERLFLKFDSFTGSLYYYTDYQRQTGYFATTTGSVIGLNAVYLWQDGEFVGDLDPNSEAIVTTPNIFVKNVEIRFVDKVNLTDEMYYPWIETPKGSFVYQNVPDRATVDLVPHLYYGTTELLTSPDICEVKWFYRLPDVMADFMPDKKDAHNKTWYEYGGDGWFPVEEYETLLDDGETKLLSIDPDTQVLTVRKEFVPFVREFKAVIYYYEVDGDRKILAFHSHAIQEVQCADSQYNLKIEKTTAANQRDILLQIKDLNNPIARWWGDWWVKTISGYEHLTVGPTREPINISSLLTAGGVQFWAMAYAPNTLNDDQMPEGVEEIATLYYMTIEASEVDALVEWSGKTAFNYDALGLLKNADNVQDNTLVPFIQWADNAATDYNIDYFAPDHTLIAARQAFDPEQADTLNIGLGYSPSNSMLQNIFIENQHISPIIHFRVKDVFDPSAAAPENNQFYVRIRLLSTGEEFMVAKQILFTKDGDQGTIGAAWYARIAPTNPPLRLAPSGEQEAPFTQEMNYLTPLVGYFDGESQDIIIPHKQCIEGKIVSTEMTVSRKALHVPTAISKSGTETVVTGAVADLSSTTQPYFRLFLRPFVYRTGDGLLEQLDPHEAYFYRAYWDVRFPGSVDSPNVKYCSWLRLFHATGIAGSPDSELAPYKIEQNPNLYENGAVSRAGTVKVNDNEHHKDGLIGFSMYPWTKYQDEYDGTGLTLEQLQAALDATFGSVEVRLFDNGTLGTTASLEDVRFRFIVKAQIDILRGQYGLNSGLVTTGETERIASISAFYPVDVLIFKDKDSCAKFFEDNGTEFYKRISTNWPRAVTYDASGYHPEFMSDPLEFHFGAEEIAINQNPNYPAFNWTPNTQSIEDKDNGTGVAQYYQPKNHLNFSEGFHGVLTTTPFFQQDNLDGYASQILSPSVEYRDAELSGRMTPFPGGMYIRNQIFRMSYSGNVDINGWDGQGIDMNEDEGTIFAPTIGAGYKDPYTNAFTGVLMGRDRSQVKSEVENNLATGHSDTNENSKYMAGLYGYQDGYQSFALMENGTAIFGRADRGGQIILDGSNAAIYGGANGYRPSLRIGDPMWNTLRISLIDLQHKSDGSWWEPDNYERELNGTYVTEMDENGMCRLKLKDECELERLRQSDWSEWATGVGMRGVRDANCDTEKYTTVNYGGDFFVIDRGTGQIAANVLPKFYAEMWRHAYVKPDRVMPYWYVEPQAYDFGELNTDEIWKSLPIYGQDRDYTYIDPNTGNPTLIANYVLEETRLQEESAIQGGAATTPQVGAEENSQFVPKNHRINYFDGCDVFRGTAPYRKFDANNPAMRSSNKQMSGFGSARVSTTPAIEVGQHIHGLMPGLISWDSYEEVFRTLCIPGDRNFLVTYDGTLWAMNGIFMGAVIGSNIIGGRIQGAEIGIGTNPNPQEKMWVIDPDHRNCDWLNLVPPQDMLKPWSQNGTPGTKKLAFYVDAKGRVIANYINIYGGSIDVGRFHILGVNPNNPNNNQAQQDPDYGHLVQCAESDFIGPSHFYGNIGIGPVLKINEKWIADRNSGALKSANIAKSTRGNLYQTRGLVAMGIPLPEYTYDPAGEPYDGLYETYGNSGHTRFWDDYGFDALRFHKRIAYCGALGMATEERASPDNPDYEETTEGVIHVRQRTRPTYSKYRYYGVGDPGIGRFYNQDDDEGGGVTVEQNAFFAIDSGLYHIPYRDSPYDTKFQGHFWPLHFHYGVPPEPEEDSRGRVEIFRDVVNAYVTTMDIFRSSGATFGFGENTTQLPKTIDASNYFRIGPWGSEGIIHWIREEWQFENDSEKPTDTHYLGWMGRTNRYANKNATDLGATRPAIGMTSWGRAPIIFKSDENGKFATRGALFIYANAYNGETGSSYRNKDKTLGDGLGDNYVDYGVKMTFGSQGEDKIRPEGDAATASNGRINKVHLNVASGYISMVIQNHMDETCFAVKNPGMASDNVVMGDKKIVSMAGLLLNPYGHESGNKGLWLFTRDGDVHITRINDSTNTKRHNEEDRDTAGPEMYMNDRNIRLSASYGISATIGFDNHASLNEDAKMAWGMDRNWGGWTHPNFLCMSAGDSGFGPGAQAGHNPGNMGITVKKNEFRLGTVEGYVFGTRDGQISFEGEYAKEENQHNIYARFA